MQTPIEIQAVPPHKSGSRMTAQEQRELVAKMSPTEVLAYFNAGGRILTLDGEPAPECELEQ